MIYSDRLLSQKLERTEARANADFVETRARLDPASGAMWIEVGGAYAMFDGVESPCTQTFGLGLFDSITDAELERLEEFYREREAPVFHEVSPLADPSLLPLLTERGYRPIELTSVMYRELDFRVPAVSSTPAASRSLGYDENSPPVLGGVAAASADGVVPSERIKTRVINESEAELWAATSAAGWASEMEGLADFMLGFGRISARCQGAYPFLAELDGSAISTGMLFIYDDVCVLAGASTVPEGRNQGAQSSLLADRLSFAAERGCKLAIMGALPGSQSQKNAEKNGFNIAYTRTKWHLPL
jgi:hypothetical protein